MSVLSPLVERDLGDQIAVLTKPLKGFSAKPAAVSMRVFLHHVNAVAKTLPDAEHAINLCDNRYLFLVALCAIVVRKQTNLLPQNKTVVTQQRLAEQYEDCYLVHDGVVDLSDLSQVNLHDAEFKSSRDTLNEFCEVPDIDLDHVAVISFTSGSTGDAKPNIKTWRTLRDSTKVNSRYMLVQADQTAYHLATVPGQHMWGLETSVLMALFSKVCMVDARPLYPHDIITTLNSLPQPRTLVSTPLHLRALVLSDIELPELASVLTATAPLSSELALTVEQKFGTELREIYGCSEAGSMAVRRTSQTDVWQRFSELKFELLKEGLVRVDAEHLPVHVTLEDNIEIIDEDRFRLNGRSGDQIKVAGKRGSLDAVNRVLLSFKGLEDGVVFFPPQDRNVPRLVALVVLKSGVSKETLRAYFREHLDAAFVPRPIMVVDDLPREENGKLVKSKLLGFYKSLK